MKESAERILDRMRPYLEADGASAELFFADEDFGIVEILLRTRPETAENALHSLRYSLEQMILRQVQGVRQVDFLSKSPPEASVAPKPEPPPPLSEVSRLRAGTGLALDMLRGLEEAIRKDTAHNALKRPQNAEYFLNGPYCQWVREADNRSRSLPADTQQNILPPLREIFLTLDRAARAYTRVLETERNAWRDEGGDARVPRVLSTDTVEESRQLLEVLDGLRPTLGIRTLDGFRGEEDAFDLLDRIFKDAARRSLRDIYIEPTVGSAKLSYRVGRRVQNVLEFPLPLYRTVLARIKHLASLDASERKRRQEGLICFTASSGYGGLTVQTLTVPDGPAERIHLRLHFPKQAAPKKATP